ncbi:MAG: polysulfide reductase NrfD [Acidobacteria bacterium]|nr:polysulfide reductase NrfD [Acidobacteriota bacterium]
MGSAKLDGQVQSEWRWLIAAYLFLAGVGGGAYMAGVIADLTGGAEWMLVSKIGVFLGVPCVLIGTFFLLADLGTPTHAWRVWMKPGTSWIARGTIIIVIFMILAAIHTAFWIWPFAGPLEANESARHFIGVFGSIFAFLTVIYTGLLLGYSQPIALWRTALLPVLFFVSAVSTGLMAIMIIAQSMGVAVAQLDVMENIDAVILIFELFVLIVYLYNAYRTLESRPSAQRILRGPVASYFWLGVVMCGLAIPLILELLGRHGAILTIGALLGLFGGLCLRFTILVGGIFTPITASGFVFARVHRPKDPMPAMGKLPPC